MRDGFRLGSSGAFSLGGGRFEATTTIRDHPAVKTLWVVGLHWPGCCECDGTHVPIGFGTGRFGEQFRPANIDFWKYSDVDVAAVESELNAWLRAGDLPDWVLGPGT